MNKNNENIDKMQQQWLDTYQKLIDSRIDIAKAVFSESFRATFEYSKIAINGAFLLNGGAAVAILYNAEHLQDKWKQLIVYCAAGAILSMLCAASSYFAQRLYCDCDQRNARLQIDYMFSHKFKIISQTVPDIKKIKPQKAYLAHFMSFISYLIFTLSLTSFCFALHGAIF